MLVFPSNDGRTLMGTDRGIVEDGWANATRQPGSTTAAAGGVVNSAVDMASGAATMASGAARMAYGHATGDEQLKQAGKEQVWGKQ